MNTENSHEHTEAAGVDGGHDCPGARGLACKDADGRLRIHRDQAGLPAFVVGDGHVVADPYGLIVAELYDYPGELGEDESVDDYLARERAKETRMYDAVEAAPPLPRADGG